MKGKLRERSGVPGKNATHRDRQTGDALSSGVCGLSPGARDCGEFENYTVHHHQLSPPLPGKHWPTSETNHRNVFSMVDYPTNDHYSRILGFTIPKVILDQSLEKKNYKTLHLPVPPRHSPRRKDGKHMCTNNVFDPGVHNFQPRGRRVNR